MDEKASEEDLKRLLQPPNASDTSSDASSSASPLDPLPTGAHSAAGSAAASANATGGTGPSSMSGAGGAAAAAACRVCGGAVGDEGLVARGQGGARPPGAPGVSGLSSFWRDEFQSSLSLQPRQVGLLPHPKAKPSTLNPNPDCAYSRPPVSKGECGHSLWLAPTHGNGLAVFLEPPSLPVSCPAVPV